MQAWKTGETICPNSVKYVRDSDVLEEIGDAVDEIGEGLSASGDTSLGDKLFLAFRRSFGFLNVGRDTC
jgi:hypothetical protein